jgi:glycosyltransferase involved in cell wall biosynthesis
MLYRVVFGIRGIVGGVDVFSERLAEQLIDRGVPCKILLRTHTWSERYPLFLNGKVPIDKFIIRKGDTWFMRWRKLIRYLEELAPCIYLPNYDFDFSGITPKLSQNVASIGIVHSDDPVHYDHVIRLGKYFDEVVGVSDAIMEQVMALPNRLKRVSKIPYGVPLTPAPVKRSLEKDAPLRVVFSGRLLHHQKRIFDLPDIFAKLKEQNTPVKVLIIGDGPDRQELENRCAEHISSGMVVFAGSLPNQEVISALQTQDAFILTSDYEGMSISLMEAMSCGCVPVVTDIRSGVPELITNGENGFIVRIGDASGFAQSLRILQSQPDLRERMSLAATERIRQNFTLEKMTDQYLKLFDRVMEEKLTGTYIRPRGPILVPPWIDLTWKDRLPGPVRRILKLPSKLKKRFRQH